jgi:thioredoxin 1
MRNDGANMATHELTSENINSVLGAKILLIDCYGPRCGHCKTFAPIFEAASNRNPDVVFGKINTDAQPGLAQGFNVKALPTLLAIKNGQIVAVRQGVQMAGQLDQLIASMR